ncbi:MAG: argininosuccinate synthase [bacterium]|nr:argininosuccinate synthase [bacterium]
MTSHSASKPEKIVLAYSGGLDTSVILAWLKETYNADVIAYVADLGQEEDLPAIEAKAVATGAISAVTDDLRETFVRDFVWPALRGNAVYEGGYLLGTSIARPCIAQGQMACAAREGADTVSHGATGKGNDQVRFELTYYALDPDINIIAPWREWDLNSREALLSYAREREIPVPVSAEKPYSVDRNMLHTSYEGGILEDPWREPDEAMFLVTTAPERAPDEPEFVEVDYREGDPVAIDGEALSPVALLERANAIAAPHGIGRLDLVENRYVGIKSRGVYETPGGTLLHAAHKAVESITMDREVMHLRDSLIPRYSELIYYGYWFSPEMRLLQTTIDEAQRGVTGTARLKLFKGSCSVVGRSSTEGLYRPEFATFEADEVYDQADATGFIRLNALRLRIQALQRRK